MPLLPLPRASLCQVIARLKPGVTIAAARAEAESLALGFAAAMPSRPGGPNVSIESLKDHVLGDSAVIVRLIFAAACLVLLITCANVAHLMLARGTSRVREVAVRVALGASRLRLARGLLAESLLFSLGAAMAGLWLSTWTVRLIVDLAPYRVPRLDDAHTGAAVFAFTLAVAVLTAVAFTVTPLVTAGNLDLNNALKEGSRQVAGSARQRWFCSLLVSMEIAVACVVLVVAGLLIDDVRRTASIASRLQPGRQADPACWQYAGPTKAIPFHSSPICNRESAGCLACALSRPPPICR